LVIYAAKVKEMGEMGGEVGLSSAAARKPVFLSDPLPESCFLVQVFPFRVHAVNEYFFLFPAATFDSFFFGDRFNDRVKPFVVDKFYTIVTGRKTVGICFFFVLGHAGGEVGCYAGVECTVIQRAHDIDVAAHGVVLN